MSKTPIFDQLVDEFHAKEIFPRIFGEFPTQADPEMTQPMPAVTDEEPEQEEQTTELIPVVPKEEPAGSKGTLYDASHLALIKPAIPPLHAVVDNETAKQIHERFEEGQQKPHPRFADDVSEAEVDEAIEGALKALEPAPKKTTQELREIGKALQNAIAPKGKLEKTVDGIQGVRPTQVITDESPTLLITVPQSMTQEDQEIFKKNLDAAGVNAKIEHVRPVQKNVKAVKRNGRLPKRKNVRGETTPPSKPQHSSNNFNFFETGTSSSPGSTA